MAKALSNTYSMCSLMQIREMKQTEKKKTANNNTVWTTTKRLKTVACVAGGIVWVRSFGGGAVFQKKGVVPRRSRLGREL